MKRMIYVAGPMTGKKDFNFPAFDDAQLQLEAKGWVVIGPQNIDRAHGFDPTFREEDQSVRWSREKLGTVFARDLLALSECESIYMLDGWEKSKGANIEKLFAEITGMNILYQSDG